MPNLKKGDRPLHFVTETGVEILPLYDAHRCRYVVYWNLEKGE